MKPHIKRPKLLVILPASSFGGAESCTYDLVRLVDMFNPVLLTQAAIKQFYSELPLPIYTFDDLHCLDPYLLSPRNIFRYARAVKDVARRERPDVILGIMHNSLPSMALASDLYRLRIPTMGTVLGSFSAYFKSINRSPSLAERLLMKYCFTRIGEIITPSKGVREDLIANFYAAPDKVYTIYNGMDLAKIRAASDAPIPYRKSCPWIVTACRLSEEKDLFTLLRAFKRVRTNKEAKLFIVGDGPLKDSVTQLAIELSIEGDIEMTGFQVNPFPYIAQADIFVLSSFYEGFGNVIVEAMALGIPVVATDCLSGPGEIIRNGENGFLVPVGDHDVMAARCLEILNRQDVAQRIAQRGRERSEDFSVGNMVRGFSDHLNKLLGI
jgi:glycosyltransferase involved in cell wall biosynthesis